MTPAGGSIATTCPYCGVGCGVRAEHAGGRLIAVAGDRDHPANAGRLCVKGSTLADTQRLEGRLLEPRIDGARVSWDAALDTVATEFRRVIEAHGPDAVAFYLSGQLLTEDYYVANKLMKGFVGSANVDTNSRLCMASAVAAHKRAFGEDVVPCRYSDLDDCELLVLVGSNAAWAHPVLYQRIAARRAESGMKVVVVDPRRTATCDIADLHLAITPGSDAVLFNALLAHLDAAGAVDHDFVDAHTEGFAEALAAARADARDACARIGVDAAELATLFDWFAATRRTVTMFSQGVNQASNGTDKANAIINCHLATGRIGMPGMGPFSITGQPNAMGGREVGGMANQLAAHRDFTPRDLDAVGGFWNAARLARGPGLKAVDMFEAVARGDIRAIWIMGTNPVVSLPRANDVAAALRACPFVVVSDCVAATDTTAYADVLLPACGWAEKDGTVTNSERTISRQRGFLPAPGEARPDWWIISRVAERLGFADAFGYAHPHEIFVEHAALSGVAAERARLFDISALAGLSRVDYDALAPVAWPLDGARPFADRCFSTESGRARLVVVGSHAPRQRTDAAHPWVLNTGRLRDQWHTMTRTGVAPRLFGHTDLPTVQLNPADAQRSGIAAGDLVEIANEFGRVRALAEPSAGIGPGQLFYPMHWSDAFAWPARIGALIDSVTDPISGQPESKHGVVALARCRVGSWLRVASRARLRPRNVLLGTSLPTDTGWRADLALDHGQNAATLLDELAATVEHDNRLFYRDAASGEQRWLLERNGAIVLAAFTSRARERLPPARFVAGALAEPVTDASWRLLAGPQGAGAACSRLVCTCFEVTQEAIERAVRAGATSTEALGQRLRCGTNCGSCLPELKGLIAATSNAIVAA